MASLYRALADRYGFSQDVVSRQTPEQTLMYLDTGKGPGGRKTVKCGSVKEARELQAKIRANKGRT